MPAPPRLVVLRGNAASGKSTVAAELRRALGPGTALVEQDHLRRVVLREHDVPGGDNVGLVRSVVRSCLDLGHDVVLEGILLAAHYGQVLRELVAEHRGPSHAFYLDVPYDEALRRHRQRPLGREVPPEEFARWYVRSDVVGLPGEVVLDATAEVTATVHTVLATVGGRRPRHVDGRYF